MNGSVQFDVASNNTVTVSDPGQPPYGSGTLDGNTFTVTAPGSSLNSPGISCGSAFVFDGTISGTTMNGNVSSSALTCNGVRFGLAGTFTASLQAELPRTITGGGIGDALRGVIRSR